MFGLGPVVGQAWPAGRREVVPAGCHRAPNSALIQQHTTDPSRTPNQPSNGHPPTWSRYTVSPSLSVSWNQSRHVTRLPVQL